MVSLAPQVSSSSFLLLDPFWELREKCFSISFICFSYLWVCVMTAVLPLSAWRIVMSLFCFLFKYFHGFCFLFWWYCWVVVWLFLGYLLFHCTELLFVPVLVFFSHANSLASLKPSYGMFFFGVMAKLSPPDSTLRSSCWFTLGCVAKPFFHYSCIASFFLPFLWHSFFQLWDRRSKKNLYIFLCKRKI